MKYMKGQVQPNMPNLVERTEAIQLSVPRSHTIPEEFLWFGQINFTGKTFDLVYSPLERLSIEQPIKEKKLPSRANGISFKPLTA